MARFIYDTNNGVTAVVTADDYERIQDGKTPEIGFFLFSDSVDYRTSTPQPWFHGNQMMLGRLLKGHDVKERSLGVPFSNGHTLYADRESLLKEIQSVAPMHQLLEAFEVQLRQAAMVS